jgi:hypothetical protein
MAGTDTALRRWMLAPTLLTVVLASYGNDNFMITMQGEAGRGKYWRCPKCSRVEWWEEGQRPWCEGTKRRRHDPVRTELETRPNARRTDRNYWFFLAD